jgi:hypothetical protein
MNIVSFSDISPQCNGSGPTYDCASSVGVPGNTAVQEYILQSNPVNLPGIPPPQGWVFTWSNCCRNASINNLSLTFSGPGNPSNGFTLRAKMFAYNGQNTSPCFDSSPIFQERPSIIICAGTPYTYNPNAYDPDLDSISYEFDRPLDYLSTGSAFTTNNPPAIPYEIGYSLSNPFPGSAQNINNVPVTLNSQTGEMSFTVFNIGNFVQVIKATSYKCGQKVAEIYREIQLANKTILGLDLEKVVFLAGQDVRLRDGDIILVPSKHGRFYESTIINAINSFAGSVTNIDNTNNVFTN